MTELGRVGEILENALFLPVRDIAGGPGKRIRAQLVHLAYRLLNRAAKPSIAAHQCRVCAEVVEYIHAGSLVIDDIEDGSRVRRGRPALHVSYSLPIALNAGNWLYFWPLHLIQNLSLPPEKKLYLYERYQHTLLMAHFGQALDLGCRIDRLSQQEIPATCTAVMTLKTGALMGFSAVMGAVAAGARPALVRLLEEFGRELGLVLQMFDDLGNVMGTREPSKQYEDLMLYRPSWIWACAARCAEPRHYREFVDAVGRLPDGYALTRWIESFDVLGTARKGAMGQLESAFRKLETGLAREPGRWRYERFEDLRRLGREITVGYE